MANKASRKEGAGAAGKRVPGRKGIGITADNQHRDLREPGFRAQARQKIHPAHPRKLQVANDGRYRFRNAVQNTQGRSRRIGHAYVDARKRFQGDLQGFGARFTIVDYQYDSAPRRGSMQQEPVPDAMQVNRDEVARAIGIWFQLLPQPDHVGVYRPGIGKRFVAPDGIKNQVSRRKRAVGILQEIRQ